MAFKKLKVPTHVPTPVEKQGPYLPGTVVPTVYTTTDPMELLFFWREVAKGQASYSVFGNLALRALSNESASPSLRLWSSALSPS